MPGKVRMTNYKIVLFDKGIKQGPGTEATGLNKVARTFYSDGKFHAAAFHWELAHAPVALTYIHNFICPLGLQGCKCPLLVASLSPKLIFFLLWVC